ncbi:MAG: PfkB family carbohydrate kinase [Planctomycetota bacterium]|jgi:sugar/nucleoside kinase (ribokinase family)
MSLLVTGSIGIDTVESPAGKAEETLGGSSIYFAQAASYFSPVRLVGVVGDDCPPDFLKPLADNPQVDLAGLEVREGSKTFRWHGKYHEDVNERDTVDVQLNVLAEVGPTIPEPFRDSDVVFLANTHPGLQIELLGQLNSPSLVAADTMDLWITGERPLLMDLLGRIDAVILNDAEAKQLTGNANVVAAGLELGDIVRRFVVVKKGEHGCLLFANGKVYAMPSFPVATVVDPTGAGDSFAGAMMGHIAAAGDLDIATVRRAMAYGTVTASITLEDFSLGAMLTATREDVDRRLAEFADLTGF